MYRFVVLLFVLSQWMIVQPSPVLAQTVSDAEAAAIVAVELSALEATGDLNSLFDRIHPHARAEIPRAAVIGWFQNEFVPLGPGVSTVTGVNFVSWTWPVTGQTYPYTAEVSFTQPFANGTVVEDVVRLVQDGNGEWRWFFGRSRAFVDEQIAKYVPAAPVANQHQSILDAVMQDIDTYWAISFAAAGQSYRSPTVVDISSGAHSSCGYFGPNEGPGFYCALNQTIYISVEWFIYFENQVGDFAWITILAHEWGHHVQAVSGTYAGPGNKQELQADCLAGSYALDAETRGLLQPGDVTEGVAISAIGGDIPGFPQDQPGAHGTGDERIAAFMRGYLDGFIGCALDLSSIGVPPPVVKQVTVEPELITSLPLQSEVPSGLTHTGDRNRTLSEVVVNYTNPTETESLFRSWGWEENVTRSYDGFDSGSGVTSVYVSIHKLDSSRSAVNALNYSLEDQMTSTGAWEVQVQPVGDTARALSTSADITIYVQQGDKVIRLTVAAPSGDPLLTAESIMRSILARAESSNEIKVLQHQPIWQKA